jgi:DNA invertase Pin-like site-specific DNA recombinase
MQLDLQKQANELENNKIECNYIRVSTLEQNTDVHELENVKQYVDKCSGSIPFKDREFGGKLLKDVNLGLIKTIHVSSIDRLGRNTLDILQTIETFNKNKVCLVARRENIRSLNDDGTVNAMSDLLIKILSTVSEMELNRIKERQKEGIAKAKTKGVYLGRNKGSKESDSVFWSKSKNQKIKRELERGETLRRTAKLTGASVGLVRKVNEKLKSI